MAKFYDTETYELTHILTGDEVFIIYQDEVSKTSDTDMIGIDLVSPLVDNLDIFDFSNVEGTEICQVLDSSGDNILDSDFGYILGDCNNIGLVYNSGGWTTTQHALELLGEIQNVTISSPQIGQMLVWTGSEWNNRYNPILKNYTETEYNIGSVSGTYNIDLNDGNVQKITVGGELEIVLPTLPLTNQHWSLVLKVIYDDVNVPSFVSPDGTLKWSRQTEPYSLGNDVTINIYNFTSDTRGLETYGRLMWSDVDVVVFIPVMFTLYNPNSYGSTAYDEYGASVDSSLTKTIVGSPVSSTAGEEDSAGNAYVYDNTTGDLLYTISDPNAYDTSLNDYFGASVSISESYCLVGATREDDAGGTYSGKAYIFDSSDGTLLWTLDNPNAYDTSQSDYFGSSVSICESYSIVGVHYEDDAGGGRSGKAYIFDNTDGSLLYTLDNPNVYSTSYEDFFGREVSITESYSIIGAYGEDELDGNRSGKAYIYDNSTGNLVWTLDNPNAYGTSESDYFGFSVSICELYSIVGAYYEDELDNLGSGKAYIFDNTTGLLLHTLDNPNAFGESADDHFGEVVAISDSYSIVCSDTEGDTDVELAGKAYIFDNITGNLLWTLDNPIPSFRDNFGSDLGISDTHCVVGVPYDDSPTGLNTGIAYLFDVSTGGLVKTLENPDTSPLIGSDDDEFGEAVAICDSYSIVGSQYEYDIDDVNSAQNISSGKAYIFDNTTGLLLHTLDNPNAFATGYGDRFGFSVSICESYSIAGAVLEDDDNGYSSGKAYIFDNTDGSLLWTLDNPNPYGTGQEDFFGNKVGICESYSIVGSEEDDAGGTWSGKAYIYDNATGNLLWTLDNPNPYGTSYRDFFAGSVAITESYSIVGARDEDDESGGVSGKAYIYDNATGNLLWTLDNPNPVGTSDWDVFGESVAISETYCVVGASGEDYIADDNDDSGMAYIFENSTGNLLHSLENPNASDYDRWDYFGAAVSISESKCVVGAYYEDSVDGDDNDAGKAYIFSTVTGELIETLDNPEEQPLSDGDHYGSAVGISNTGVIVGAHYAETEDGSGSYSGRAYIKYWS